MLVPLFGKYFLAALGVLHRFATEIKPSKLDLDNTSGRNEIMYKYFFILLLFQNTILASNVLTGVVVDIQNQTPIEGVNITCGEEGTTSNFEGKFEIKPDSDSISFSHIGFENTLDDSFHQKSSNLEFDRLHSENDQNSGLQYLFL